MKVSYKWLSEYVDGKLSPPAKLAELLTIHSFEVEGVEKIGKDWVFDVSVLPNRAHDCLSHFGVAKEATAITKSKIKNQKSKIKENRKFKIGDYIKIKVKDRKLCARYTSRVILGVRVEPSPKWLKERLESVGQKSINNVVDATNYVMLALGQPTHAFDLDKIGCVNPKSEIRNPKIQTKKIIVRKAKEGEKIITLDNQEIKLDENILVIADEKDPLAIAGIKGGKKAEVDADTKNIVLESACFDPVSVRTTSKWLGLRTDSSTRFENGISPALQPIALDYLASMIVSLAGGEIIKGAIDTNPRAYKPVKVFFTPERINKILGAQISEKEMISILKRLDFKLQPLPKKKGYAVIPPPERLDIQIEEDVAEEIARIYGLDKIPHLLPEEVLTPPVANNEYILVSKIRPILAGAGLSETYNRSFIGERQLNLFGDWREIVVVANPLSEDQKYLRPSLLFNLLANVSLNLKNRKEVKLFEIGKVFELRNGGINERMVVGGIIAEKKTLEVEPKSARQFFELKGVIDLLSEKIGVNDFWYDGFQSEVGGTSSGFWHFSRTAEIKVGDRTIGIVGDINPILLDKLGITEKVAAFELNFADLLELAEEKAIYTPISKFPAIERDIAVIVPADVKVDDAQAVIENAGGPLLLDSDLFDIYEGEHLEADQKSLAFHLIFQSSERTLTDAEINVIFEKIVKAVEAEGWGVRK